MPKNLLNGAGCPALLISISRNDLAVNSKTNYRAIHALEITKLASL